MTTWTRNSPLADRVQPSPAGEVGPRPNGLADVKFIVVHMAEGGGTANHLDNLDGNSSHYVVEYDGSVTQMVRESYWAGSINPRLIRKDETPYFTAFGERLRYGRAEVVGAVGATVANDPNRYAISIEIEGFAAAGPNTKQNAMLKRLVADIRARRAKPLPVFGHRDFQSYKACPGKLIRWVDFGGHAKATTKTESAAPAPTPVPPAEPVKTFTRAEVDAITADFRARIVALEAAIADETKSDAVVAEAIRVLLEDLT